MHQPRIDRCPKGFAEFFQRLVGPFDVGVQVLDDLAQARNPDDRRGAIEEVVSLGVLHEPTEHVALEDDEGVYDLEYFLIFLPPFLRLIEHFFVLLCCHLVHEQAHAQLEALETGLEASSSLNLNLNQSNSNRFKLETASFLNLGI